MRSRPVIRAMSGDDADDLRRRQAMGDTDAELWRLWLFLGLLTALVLAERLRPGPNPPPRRARRWPAHVAIIALDTLLVRLLLPAGAVGAALWAQARGVGLFNALPVPTWVEWVLGLLVLDLVIYWQHRWMHTLPGLWRLHRMHHTDPTLDATSALRFHPFEMLLSLAYKCVLAVALGIDPAVLLVFEALLSSFALFTHANLALPPALDRRLRWLFVTPAMHWIHHSPLRAEQHRNYGFHLSVWDRLFRSYARTASETPQRFGLAGASEDRGTRLPALLREPFRPE
jgi:sterol desaturase/sphingolipid hydroxylase (fatty acid hydroxylase superfamily)